MFEDRGVDYVMAIAVALAEELSTLRDRLDLVERIAHDKGIILSKEIEDHTFDDDALKTREVNRQAYLERVFAIYAQETSEIGEVSTPEAYEKILEELAER